MILSCRPLKNYPILKNALILAVLTAIGILIAGYHPGAEDDAVYLAAIKRDLNSALFPHDSDFFAVQLQATVFDKLVAVTARATQVPLGWVVLAWHYLAVYLVLLGCWRISRRCFREEYAQWASVTLVAVLLTLPVSGSALYLVDQNLHPRALATAAILAAIVSTLDRKYLLTGALLVLAALIHPIMACFGISFCIFLGWRQPTPQVSMGLLALAPLGWIFEPTSEAWQVAANTRDYYYLSRWQWYEWLGVLAPLLILWWFRKMAEDEGASPLRHLTSRLIWYGSFQFIIAVALMLPVSLQRVRPLQPMRYLHLFYVLFVLIAGGFLGQKILRTHRTRWVAIFIPLAAGMFFAQRQTYPSSPHLEWPGAAPRNAWLEAFSWIREHTPTNSYFAAGANYMRRPGEDYHGFRALAERSVLADLAKDSAVATQVPRLAQRWKDEVDAQSGWEHFRLADFQRLKARFGVDWVLIERPGVEGLECPYEKGTVLVCRVP